MKRQKAVIAVGTILFLGTLSSSVAQTTEEDLLKSRMTTAMENLDTAKSGEAIPWDEFVVLLYTRLQGRAPILREFAVLNELHDRIGLKPSEGLSLVLRGNEPCPTYAQIRLFLDSKDADAFVSTAESKAMARDLAAASRAYDWSREIEPAKSSEETNTIDSDPPNVAYHVYFGYVHSHTSLSDGEGTPDEAYALARENGLDFFGITDHGELLMLWPWENKYTQVRYAADSANDPGLFATLYGFEWTNPILGHICAVNTDEFTHVLQNFTFSSFYAWLEAHPEAFGIFNHPGWSDEFQVEFYHGRLFSQASPQMVGVALWDDVRSFDGLYYEGSWNNDLSYFDVMNRQGWRLGALGDEDNHYANWGHGNFRTAVLAEELTRESIVDAYRHRRFYSTEDKDLSLDLRCGGYPMGSIVSGVPRKFRVTASDGSGDTFAEIRFYRNGELLDTRAVEGNTVDAAFSDWYASEDAYYYVIVRQTDDNDANGRNDEAISSPIWYGAPHPVEESIIGCLGLSGSGTTGKSSATADMLTLLVVPGVLGIRGRIRPGRRQKKKTSINNKRGLLNEDHARSGLC